MLIYFLEFLYHIVGIHFEQSLLLHVAPKVDNLSICYRYIIVYSTFERFFWYCCAAGVQYLGFAFAPLPPPPLESPSLCHGHPSSPYFSSLSFWVACSSYCFYDMLRAMRAQIRTQLVTLPPFPPCPLTTFALCPRWSLQPYSHTIPTNVTYQFY